MADKGKIGIVLKELKSKVPQLLRSMKRHWIITSVIVVFLSVSVVALFLYEFDFEESGYIPGHSFALYFIKDL